ncbi:hypothetical protein SEUCBS139899_006980 [Sporothrix eucalyptigena]
MSYSSPFLLGLDLPSYRDPPPSSRIEPPSWHNNPFNRPRPTLPWTHTGAVFLSALSTLTCASLTSHPTRNNIAQPPPRYPRLQDTPFPFDPLLYYDQAPPPCDHYDFSTGERIYRQHWPYYDDPDLDPRLDPNSYDYDYDCDLDDENSDGVPLLEYHRRLQEEPWNFDPPERDDHPRRDGRTVWERMGIDPRDKGAPSRLRERQEARREAAASRGTFHRRIRRFMRRHRVLKHILFAWDDAMDVIRPKVEAVCKRWDRSLEIVYEDLFVAGAYFCEQCHEKYISVRFQWWKYRRMQQEQQRARQVQQT